LIIDSQKQSVWNVKVVVALADGQYSTDTIWMCDVLRFVAWVSMEKKDPLREIAIVPVDANGGQIHGVIT